MRKRRVGFLKAKPNLFRTKRYQEALGLIKL
jgi:hypothetical protein